jgi:Fe-S-cluster containining protein
LLDAAEVTAQQDLPAGPFTAWLAQMRHALKTSGGSDVPCGDCNACCRSSYFIHVAADETATLARIPKPLLFAAPGQRDGTRVMGYDASGRCPMLVEQSCSIYADRPRTCRTFDCRVFAAAGIAHDDADHAPIAVQARRWRFDYADERDSATHAAVRATANFLREHATELADLGTRTATQIAILAVKVYPAVERLNEASKRSGTTAGASEVVAAIRAEHARF